VKIIGRRASSGGDTGINRIDILLITDKFI
jgi:hypothetical protein